jgi:hypothetical protein
MMVGSHAACLKLIPMLLMLTAGAMTFSLAQTWLQPGLCLLAMAMFLLNPATLYSSCLVMSNHF